ncbi:MAG TPA: DUF3168 domain-containing protein [Symbiobacteriaceae bacterium]|nr:DUF3168 domain-containing protein [Symbiobacteriaceae bacterium]
MNRQQPTVRQAAFAHAAEHPGIQALVGDRIYHINLPQNPVYPAVTVRLISDVGERDLSGLARSRARVEFSCWDKSPKGAEKLALEVQAAFQDYTGLMAGVLQVLDCDIVSYESLYDAEIDVYQVPADVQIRYRVEG